MVSSTIPDNINIVMGLFIHVVQEELFLTNFMTNFQNKAEVFRFSLTLSFN